MGDVTINDGFLLNILISEQGMRKGTIKLVPKVTEDLALIECANINNPDKMPKHMLTTETRRTFTNVGAKVIRQYWVYDLDNGKRAISYQVPYEIKTMHNNRLVDVDRSSSHKYNVPDNVVKLWRITATYLIEGDKEVFHFAEARLYTK